MRLLLLRVGMRGLLSCLGEEAGLVSKRKEGLGGTTSATTTASAEARTGLWSGLLPFTPSVESLLHRQRLPSEALCERMRFFWRRLVAALHGDNAGRMSACKVAETDG